MAMRALTQFCWKVELLATFASLGSLPETGWPVLDKMPLPASGNHCASLPVCAPYLAMEKLASLLRFAGTFATQLSMGMVSMACAPPALLLEMKVSPRSPAVA